MLFPYWLIDRRTGPHNKKNGPHVKLLWAALTGEENTSFTGGTPANQVILLTSPRQPKPYMRQGKICYDAQPFFPFGHDFWDLHVYDAAPRTIVD